jgi:DNA-binding MarR family transcriptional regulator
MSMPDDAVEARAQGWRTLAALHARIEDRLGRALEGAHEISVSEYTVLDVLSRQDEHHMRMQQLAGAVVLSQSATTRLVTRLEERGLLARYLCADDRRGIYSQVTEAGAALLAAARPTHDAAVREALEEAELVPELEPLVRALEALPAAVAAGAAPRPGGATRPGGADAVDGAGTTARPERAVRAGATAGRGWSEISGG